MDQRIYEEVEWLQDYRSEIYHWNCLTLIAQAARNVIRLEGVHNLVAKSFIDSIGELHLSNDEIPFVDKITEFLMEQARDLKAGERLLGTSEPIESVFGELKFLEKEQQKFGFTALALAMFAAVGPIDEVTVRTAMEQVRQSDIDTWYKNNIGESVQKQRRSLRKRIDRLIRKVGQKTARFYRGESRAI
ncbi:hypothetical protein SCG7086_AR_00020 [Chlamydiales bacterium SCGC AG-110-P3]|nr:hypothetical protein SCG7086_AR_00020 [Chlamydiales bacterium SCGC AG-110-P3]